MNSSHSNPDSDAIAVTAALVSVIIPCYKMGMYIGEALESVGKQSYTRWEVIAVDDCGPEDGTREIVESFAASHPEHRVEFIRHEKNGGVSKARNTAIHAAKGEFLAFLDPDDFWGVSFILKHMKVLEADDNISASYTDARFVNDQGMVTGGVWGPDDREHRGLPESLYRRNFIAPCTVVARTESVLHCGGFDESPEIQHVEDWDLWLRMLHEGAKFSYTPSAESFYRKHEQAATADPTAVRLRESALRRKHSELPTSYTLELVTAMERRIKQLEGKQRAYEGSVFFRIGRSVSKLIALPASVVKRR
jgi:glycosyltransferase involved in cell wall biosynthesis